jgi:ribosomal-protein-alanine N-acetyltransferase
VSDFEIVTRRLTLREWRDDDRAEFARMNADPQVMEFFLAPLRQEESDAAVDRFVDEFRRRGFCPWAVEERESNSFVGCVGLHEVPESLSFAPAVEVGWRLARSFWGRGYATEGATSSVNFAFGVLGLDEVVSMTTLVNRRSSSVMERLGMQRDPAEDFEHPNIPLGHDLRPHMLYRLTRSSWRSRASAELIEGSNST